MINMQTFVSGSLPGLQVLDPRNGCREEGPRPGLWSGSIIQFFVSPDGTKLTSNGSPIRCAGMTMPWEIKWGPIACPDGRTLEVCVATVGGHDIIGNTFSYKNPPSSQISYKIDGQFLTSTSSQGTASCFSNTVNWTATPKSGTSAAPLETPSTNNPPVLEQLYDVETGAYIGEMTIYYK